MIKLVAHAGRRAELDEFLRWDAEVARTQEPGTLRFDVWEVPEEPDAVYVYEAYVGQAAFQAQQEGEPFKKFVGEIVPSVIEPIVFVPAIAQSTASNADG
jgi:quinol monooxygenase YgiN